MVVEVFLLLLLLKVHENHVLLGAGWCVGVAYQQRPGSSNGCPIRPDGRNQEQAEWGEPLLVEGTQVAHQGGEGPGFVSFRARSDS